MGELPRFSAGARWLRGGSALSGRRRALVAVSVGLATVGLGAYAVAWPAQLAPSPLQVGSATLENPSVAGEIGSQGESVAGSESLSEDGVPSPGASSVSGGSVNLSGLGGVGAASSASGAKSASSSNSDQGASQNNGSNSSSSSSSGSHAGSGSSGGSSEPATPSKPSIDQDKEQRFATFLSARASEVSSLESQASSQMSAFDAGLDAAACSQNARICSTISGSCFSVQGNLINCGLRQNGSAYGSTHDALIAMSRCLGNAMGYLSNAWDGAAAGNSGYVNENIAKANAAISEYNSWASKLS